MTPRNGRVPPILRSELIGDILEEWTLLVPQTEGGTKAMFEKQQAWAREHIILNNVHHAAGAFGLAIVLQHYLAGNPFLPVAVGWVLLGFTVTMHLYQFTR